MPEEPIERRYGWQSAIFAGTFVAASLTSDLMRNRERAIETIILAVVFYGVLNLSAKGVKSATDPMIEHEFAPQLYMDFKSAYFNTITAVLGVASTANLANIGFSLFQHFR